MFSGWEKDFDDGDLLQKILEGWSHVCIAIISESSRESYFKIMHCAFYRFDSPAPYSNALTEKQCFLSAHKKKLTSYMVFGHVLLLNISGNKLSNYYTMS